MRCPTSCFVLELGVGNGNQAKTWLDEFATRRQHGTEYYRRLHYLMCDYSAHVLALARENVSEHAAHVSSPRRSTHTTPTTALGFLRYKVFLVYISNVYDNLPTDERRTASAGTSTASRSAPTCPRRPRLRIAADVQHRARSPRPRYPQVCSLSGRSSSSTRCPRTSPTWSARLPSGRRSGMPSASKSATCRSTGLDSYQIAPGVGGEMLRPLLEAQRRRTHARQQRRGRQLRRHAAAAAPVRPPAVPRHLRDRPAPVPDRLPRPRQVRRVGRQLGQRPAAAAHRPAQGLRRRPTPAVRPPDRDEHRDPDRSGHAE